ncbi:MAG: twin-arginine translocation signal domain-containing protein [Anaerolineales bacterium]|nr:twin-arginine translocation signal domain-containing protein [Anaerolineales bacterium]
MKNNFSRRDFLKVAGVGLGAMAFKPFDFETLYTPKRLPQFPASEIIGRVLGMTDVRNRPSNDPLQATAVTTFYDDNLIEWGREVIGNAVGLTNQKFLETPQGYIWASRVQPTKKFTQYSHYRNDSRAARVLGGGNRSLY